MLMCKQIGTSQAQHVQEAEGLLYDAEHQAEI